MEKIGNREEKMEEEEEVKEDRMKEEEEERDREEREKIDKEKRVESQENQHQEEEEMEEEEELQRRIRMTQQNPAFYTDAAEYWSKIPATVNGMLGGFAYINKPDIVASEAYLQSLFKMRAAPGHQRAVDCGAGIGRITKHLLQKHFGKTDLVEQCPEFLAKARHTFKDSRKIGEYICIGLQDFTPKPRTYDVIWSQWVLGHLNDEDLICFFKRMADGLKENGLIVVKENVTSSGAVELDEIDSSVTRPQIHLLELIEKSGLRVLKNVRQTNFPKGLYEVRMLCLRPKDRRIEGIEG